MLQKSSLGVLWYLMKSLEGDSRFIEDPGNLAATYLPILDIACDLAPSLYTAWVTENEREERLSREVEKLSALLEGQQLFSSTPAKKAVWTSSTANPKEKVKRVRITISLLRFPVLIRIYLNIRSSL